MANKSLTISSFIQKANTIHNNSYDYTDTVFISTRDKLQITCPSHGPFTQRASAHLCGQGCPQCKNESVRSRFISTKEEFLNSIPQWHKDNLDFSDFVYITDKIKGQVKCKIHGDIFLITPNNIKKSKRACPKCARDYHSSCVRNTKQDFINMSIEKHGDVFDYSKLPESFHSHDYIDILKK